MGSIDAYALGSRLRLRREHLGLTQKQVADAAGISRQLLVKIEQGHPRAELGKVMAVVRALDAALTITDRVPGSSEFDLDKLLRDDR